jgi:hypothetical protein
MKISELIFLRKPQLPVAWAPNGDSSPSHLLPHPTQLTRFQTYSSEGIGNNVHSTEEIENWPGRGFQPTDANLHSIYMSFAYSFSRSLAIPKALSPLVEKTSEITFLG